MLSLNTSEVNTTDVEIYLECSKFNESILNCIPAGTIQSNETYYNILEDGAIEFGPDPEFTGRLLGDGKLVWRKNGQRIPHQWIRQGICCNLSNLTHSKMPNFSK